MFYFEEIFNNVIILFRESYRIDKNDKTYVKSLSDDFWDLDFFVKEFTFFNDYEKMLPTIIFQTIPENFNENEILLRKISMSDFEKKFIDNFLSLKKLGYIQNYNDYVRDYLGWFDNKNKNLTLEDYLKKYNLKLCKNRFERDQVIEKLKKQKSLNL